MYRKQNLHVLFAINLNNIILLSIAGPYASFAGRDASRNLATFNVEPNNKEEYDDLSDLNAMEMDSVREWEMQFKGNNMRNQVGPYLKKHFLFRKIRSSGQITT